MALSITVRAHRITHLWAPVNDQNSPIGGGPSIPIVVDFVDDSFRLLMVFIVSVNINISRFGYVLRISYCTEPEYASASSANTLNVSSFSVRRSSISARASSAESNPPLAQKAGWHPTPI